VLGGLSAADASLDEILELRRGRTRTIGRLPVPLHDAAAATVGSSSYLFGGGGTAGSSAAIVRIETSGQTSPAGRLPAPVSDIEAATVGGTVYVIGGYTGVQSLEAIVAWRPGRRARAVAALPHPLRYAAVTAVGRSVLVAGGTTGNALTSAIVRFDTGSGRVRRLGSLPLRRDTRRRRVTGRHLLRDRRASLAARSPESSHLGRRSCNWQDSRGRPPAPPPLRRGRGLPTRRNPRHRRPRHNGSRPRRDPDAQGEALNCRAARRSPRGGATWSRRGMRPSVACSGRPPRGGEAGPSDSPRRLGRRRRRAFACLLARGSRPRGVHEQRPRHGRSRLPPLRTSECSPSPGRLGRSLGNTVLPA
jgi:hypothetical protein